MEQEVARSIEEQLSAFLDGELPEEELALLVRRLERDEAYRSTLDRYALIGGVLRGEQSAVQAAGLRGRVMNTLDDQEPGAELPVEAPLPKRRVQSGYLIAASVAAGFVAVFLSGTLEQPSGEQLAVNSAVPAASVAADPAAAADADAAVVSVAAVTGSGQGDQADVAALKARHQEELRRIRLNQERMRSYLISHGEYARPLQGALADSRMYIQQASFED